MQNKELISMNILCVPEGTVLDLIKVMIIDEHNTCINCNTNSFVATDGNSEFEI